MNSPPHPLEGLSHDRWIRQTEKPENGASNELRCVDLFSGCGGLSLGIMEYCRVMSLGHRVELASDWDHRAIEVYAQNIVPKDTHVGDILELFDGTIGQKPTSTELQTIRRFKGILRPDVLSGGPPCQGHSDLNNHTRRGDPRNSLYLRMVRAAEILEPNAVIIENVSTVVHSKERVVQTAVRELERIGYKVMTNILWANKFGVPQKRKRHFLIASKFGEPNFEALERFELPKDNTLRWAIEDLSSGYCS